MDYGKQTLEKMDEAKNYANWLLAQIRPYLKGEVLEVGCGLGTFTKRLVGYGLPVWALDMNRNYLTKVRKEISKDKATIFWADIEQGVNLPKYKKFKTILCFNVLEHLKDDKGALKNIYKLLKIDGYLLLIIPAHRILFGEMDKALGHHRRYEKKDLEMLLRRSGFFVEKTRSLNLFGVIGWLVNSRILRRRLLPKNQLRIFDKLLVPLLKFENWLPLPFGLSLLAVARKTK